MSSNYYTKTVMLLMFLYSVGLHSQTTRSVCLEGCDFTTIQAAINASDAGDIIQLSAQDYSESPITLNKNLTIAGANAGLAGNDDARGAESRIVNTRITVTTAATLDGLEIFQTNNTSDAVLIQAAATFKNSIVRREGVTTGVVARGVVTAVGTSGYLIENNLINGDPSGGLFGSHLTWNSGIWINGGNGSVQGNTILNCRTAINIDEFNVNTDLVNNTFEYCGTFIAIGGTVAPNGQFTLGANAFKNLVSTFINLSNVNPAFRLDITSSSYNGEIFEDMELGDLFIIEATMFHRGRSGRNGIVDYVLDKQFVVDLNPGIQAAVNASSNAGTICVAPGTYGTGNISINKALDIRGANYGINPNTGSRGSESIISGTFLLQSNNISIDGFAITGNSFAIQAPGTGQSEISILNNHMYSNTGGRTIEYWGPRQAATQWTISNNLIEDILANDATAITLFNIEGLTVSDNVILHNNEMFNGRRGLNLDGCRDANMSGNYINLGLESPLSDNSDGSFTKARYSLQLSASDRSVSDVTVALNTFTGGYDGMITLGNGTYNGILISNNEMANNVLGIRFQAGTNVPEGAHENITIQGNNINSSNRCIYLQDGTSGGGTADPYENLLIVNNSLIRSEAGMALEVQSTAVLIDDPVTATCNWWGTDSNMEIMDRVSILNVEYLPFLISGIDSDPETTGFQPAESSCGGPVSVYEDLAETTLISVHSSIQNAINASTTLANYVVRVQEGVYNENLIINKAVNLRGANFNNDCGETRLAETILAPTSGLPVNITADGVSINGFEITAPSYQNAIVCGNRSDLSISYNNIHHINSSNSPALTPTHAIQYTVANSPASTFNVNISDNCFSFVGSSNLTGSSASAIGFLQSPSTGTLTNLTISRNTISDVEVSDLPWPTGRIAYGILINIGGNANFATNGKVVNTSILNNEISNLSGHIATGIGLEGNTENAEIKNNSVSNLSGTKIANRSGGGFDISGLKFENNRYVGTVVVEANAFNSNTFENNDIADVGYAVSNYVPTSFSGAAQVGCNWLGSNFSSAIEDNDELTGKVFNKENCITVFTPFLSTGTDTDLEQIGFQPDLSNQGGAIASVSGNSQPIVNGSSTFSATNLTLMGSVNVNSSLVRNYQLIIGSACGGEADTEILNVSTSNEDNFLVSGIENGSYSSETVINFTITYFAGETPTEHTTICTISTVAGDYTFGLKGVTVAPEILPAIAEVRGNNIVISNGDFTPSSFDNTDFGSRATPGVLTGVFTISNLGQQGSDDLVISDISFSGANASNFTLTSQPCGSISAESSCQIEVTFDSGNTTGNYEATIVIANSDPGKNPYEFALKAVVLSPNMSVRGSNVNIENGSETPVANNNTFFGNASAGQMLNKTFSIKNIGLGLLTIPTDAVTLLAVSGGEENFEVITQPVSPLATNQETFFSIRFTSPGQGYFTAKVSIETSAGPFTFDIAATGPSPRMNVTGNNISIPTGSITVATNNFTDYGTRNLNTNLDRTFYVRNPSNMGALAQLLLSGTIRAEVSGPGAAMFTVIAQPAATIGINGSSLLRIRYRPTQAGCHWALITIANNDPARNPYTFVVRGNTAGQACSDEYQELNRPISDPLYSYMELDENSELSVYPNPARTSLWIEAPLRSNAYDLEVINLEGKTIHSLKTIGGLLEINIHQWVPGLYVLRSRDMEFTPIRIVKI